MAETPPSLPLRDEILMDRLFSPLAFNELTTTVESMMLSKPLERPEVNEYTGERALIAELGAQGLRVALECKNGLEPCESGDEDSLSARMMNRPDEFVDREMPGVAEWAEAFGDALLREAYKCLGNDAEQKLQAYREATTADEQAAIITWLDERMQAMQEPTKYTRDGEPQDYLFYHPVRLSPKAIGRYPNVQLPPTCLGFSILATSFLYAAGAPTMHAGVMRTDNQEDLIEASMLSYRTGRNLEGLFGGDTDLSAALRDLAYFGLVDLWEADAGYHAVALTRLLDGRWAQIDPNFSSTQVVGDALYNERLTRVYDDLEEFAPVAPLLELTASTPFDSDVKEWVDAYSPALEIPSRSFDDLAKIFTDDDAEAFPTRIYRVVLDMYCFSYGNEDPETPVAKARPRIEDELFFADNDGATDYVSDATPLGNRIYSLISRYVLYEQDPRIVKERCRKDKRYLERRISDVVAVVAAIHTIQASILVNGSRTDVPHPAYEVGRPATRVAMTVLGDYATLLAKNPLPPTFWHSNWPSLVPITESASGAHTEVQKRAVATMAEFVRFKHLQYLKDYGNIIPADAPSTEKE